MPGGTCTPSRGGGCAGIAGCGMLTRTTELPRSSTWCSCRVRRSCFHAMRLFSTLPLFLAPTGTCQAVSQGALSEGTNI